MSGQSSRTKAMSIRHAPSHESPTFIRDFAIEVAKGAGEIIRQDFGKPISVELKDDTCIYGQVVTGTDKKTNSMIISAIHKQFPTHDIIAEEGNLLNAVKSSDIWVVDPLDGSKEYLDKSNKLLQTQLPVFFPRSFVSIALTKDGRPELGVEYDPFNDRTLYAEIKKGAFLNGKRLKLSEDKSLKGALVGLDLWEGMQFDLNPLKKLIEGNGTELSNGPIIYMGTMVASGLIPAFVHPARMGFDSAASKIIIEEAGGRVTDLFGNEQRYDGSIKGCVMSNWFVHEELLSLIRKTVNPVSVS